MLSDRRRHEQLARQRLEKRKNRVKRTILSRENIIENGDNVLLQEAVIKFLENKHYKEREAMLNLLEYEDNDLENLVQSMTSEQRGDHLRQLKEKKESLNKGLFLMQCLKILIILDKKFSDCVPSVS